MTLTQFNDGDLVFNLNLGSHYAPLQKVAKTLDVEYTKGVYTYTVLDHGVEVYQGHSSNKATDIYNSL